ncbi:hypothetical protein GCM10018785_47980 [Streptomyces longispororuber]|uniref:Uncharacterized protein n=1 Tax=Streptomyces longispororuber TaxID=68230 RepID=A0A918ZXH0_9ACTN|nr:hypothetical protein GCM10018785_47980 [Streptomyces longispororuber]
MAVRGVLRPGVAVMELSFCWRYVRVRGCSAGPTARTGMTGEVHVDALVKEKLRGHGSRLSTPDPYGQGLGSAGKITSAPAPAGRSVTGGAAPPPAGARCAAEG